MTATVYYYGWEVRVEAGIEAAAGYGTAPASGAFIGLSYVRSVSWNINENVENLYTSNRAVFMWPTLPVKGLHQATFTLNFWLPDDMSATVNETWILKAPLDEFNDTYAATKHIVPNAGTSIYGSYNLQSYTVEIVHDKIGSETGFRFSGSYVNRMTMTINKGEPIMWSFEYVCRNAELITTQTNGAASVIGTAAIAPLNWANVVVTWTGENDAAAAKTDFTNITVVLDNGMEPNYDLTDQSATADRIPSEFILGYNGRRITGTFTANMTTQAGTLWNKLILGDATTDVTPDNSVQLGALIIQINSVITVATTANIKYTFYEVTIGELPMDIDFSKVQEITIPWEARYYLWEFTTADETPPTLWLDED